MNKKRRGKGDSMGEEGDDGVWYARLHCCNYLSPFLFYKRNIN